MQKKIFQYKFLKDNIYLLILSFLLLCASLFTQQKVGDGVLQQNFVKQLQKYISNAENEFDDWKFDNQFENFYDTKLANTSLSNVNTKTKQLLFLYDTALQKSTLLYWNNQLVIPDTNTLNNAANKGLALLQNGYYLYQKKYIANKLLIALLPIKWNYLITNQYLKNDFLIGSTFGNNFDITLTKSTANATLKNGDFLFGISEKASSNDFKENGITIFLRMLSLLFFLFFLHFTAVHIQSKKGIFYAGVYLISVLLFIRLITYIFYDTINLRQFELFDPTIYGANFILKSLGDLLINILLFLWAILFFKNNVSEQDFKIVKLNFIFRVLCTIAISFLILLSTFISESILQSMVADSQISFDVMNFFSLDVYSVIGFFVLCAIAIGYYHFISIAFFVAKKINNDKALPFFFSVATLGLCFLTFRVGREYSIMELFGFFWLLLFLLIINTQLKGYFTNKTIFSKSIFWLFFFSLTITSVIIYENSIKELYNRKHYAEVVTTKTNSINEAVLNTILTEFRPSVIATKFGLFKNVQTATLFKDSLLRNNFNTYNNNYETNILVYDNEENGLFNTDATTYNAINSILNTQGKPTTINGLYYFDKGYDKFSYVAKRNIVNNGDSLLGYIFIVITPKKIGQDELSPTLFSRANNQNLRPTNLYDYAIYKNGKLLFSQNDYAFSTNFTEKYFLGNQFLQQDNGNYNELWYNAGGNKYVVIVKENKRLFELITLLSFLFCSFVFFNSATGFLSVTLKARFKWRIIKEYLKFSIKQQVQTTIIAFSILSFIVIGIATILFFTSRHETNNRILLSNTSKLVANDLAVVINKQQIDTVSFTEAQLDSSSVAKLINNLAKIHKQEINLYSVEGNLKASSLSLPYLKGIVSTKMHPTAYEHIHDLEEIQYYQNEQIGTLHFVSNYLPILDTGGKQMAYVHIPYFTSQSKLKDEISSFLVTIIILNAFILLVAGLVAIIITNRITNSFSFISDKMKQINLNKHNEIIVWQRNDEIGALVKEYNKMVTKLDISAAALARNEREYAWQEMAKQVAHEIKNPLTPMKLSMQFLQKAINEDAPNVKEISAKVSATLVEQIDHLSNIAGEFSQFADIEKANETTFDVNEIFISLKELYHTNTELSITWIYTKNPMYILADKTHINRTFTNLILNGIQAVSSPKIPTLIIEQLIVDDNMITKITDNGSGIPETLKENIFMPNFTTKSSGTGLGLSMCKRMVEQAGGTIYFETSLTGTTFFVCLPLLK